MSSICDIKEYHKQRYPYLLIDSIDELELGKCVKVHKNFTENEWLFHCSEYSDATVPFTLQLEILSEVYLIPILALEECKGKTPIFLSADEVEAFGEIRPGDRLDIEATVERWNRGMLSGLAKGYVNGQLVCSAKMKSVFPEIMNQYKPRNT
ncbi:MAG: beta-hydroxyacyl-ACP dehydratase [Lachnospiraceae bacterium]|nr:beta-hydroxyacyl-ACP dehydratase [Lachnospiraceae bacterium]